MRLYDGCPDSELKAKWDETARLTRNLNKLDPHARAVYFPMEQRYSVWSGLRQLTDEHVNRDDALREAIENLCKP